MKETVSKQPEARVEKVKLSSEALNLEPVKVGGDNSKGKFVSYQDMNNMARGNNFPRSLTIKRKYNAMELPVVVEKSKDLNGSQEKGTLTFEARDLTAISLRFTLEDIKNILRVEGVDLSVVERLRFIGDDVAAILKKDMIIKKSPKIEDELLSIRLAETDNYFRIDFNAIPDEIKQLTKPGYEYVHSIKDNLIMVLSLDKIILTYVFDYIIGGSAAIRSSAAIGLIKAKGKYINFPITFQNNAGITDSITIAKENFVIANLSMSQVRFAELASQTTKAMDMSTSVTFMRVADITKGLNVTDRVITNTIGATPKSPVFMAPVVRYNSDAYLSNYVIKNELFRELFKNANRQKTFNEAKFNSVFSDITDEVVIGVNPHNGYNYFIPNFKKLAIRTFIPKEFAIDEFAINIATDATKIGIVFSI